MRNRRGQINVAHALTADFCQRDFNATFLTDDPFIFHALIFTAQTFIILDRAEDTRTEQAVFFRLKCPVVNRFRLFHLTKRPAANLLRDAIEMRMLSKLCGPVGCWLVDQKVHEFVHFLFLLKRIFSFALS